MTKDKTVNVPVEADENLEADYDWPEMPRGAFVGEVYYLTHNVIAALKSSEDENDCFIAAETAIREYVWKAAQRAHKAALQSPVDGWRDIGLLKPLAAELMDPERHLDRNEAINISAFAREHFQKFLEVNGAWPIPQPPQKESD